MSEANTAPLAHDAWVTQYGRLDPTGFRVRPRPGVETGISLIEGRLTAAEAHRLIIRHGPFRKGLDAVRHARIGDLVRAGFHVRRDPTLLIREHLLVEYGGEWDDAVAERFDRSFGQPES